MQAFSLPIETYAVPTTARALLVDANEKLSILNAQYLEENGVFVAHVSDGDAALRGARQHVFDVVLLDLMLPSRDGLRVCRTIRTFSSVPIILFASCMEEPDVLAGFELGADHCVSTPFLHRELVARIRAVVRRTRGYVGPTAFRFSVGPLTLHASSMTATWNGALIELTSYEFAILQVLVERRGQVVRREQILDLAKRGAENAFERSIDVRISRLRRKLGANRSGSTSIIRTVRGEGYALDWDNHTALE